MSNLSINNLNKVEEIAHPYPIIVYSNLLNDVELKELQESLSNKEISFDKIVMGNRKTLLKGTINFEKFVENNNVSRNINHFFDNKEVFEFFYKNLQSINKKNLNGFDFFNKDFKYLKNYISRKKFKFLFKVKNRITKTFFSVSKDNCGVYCDFDFSVAGKGYEREPHFDSKERILNFLFYINDFDSNNGGSFQIYKYKNEPNKYIQQPLIEDLLISKNLVPKKGSLVTFLSSPQSIHGVDKINHLEDKRYFFYGSYTSIKEIEWKKIN